MRRDRIMVTVSPEMRVALGILARRAGIVEATQATITLRQALDRTINSAECDAELRALQAHRTVKEWREDTAADVAVSNLIEQTGGRDATPQTTAQLPAATAPTTRRGARKVHRIAVAPIYKDEPLYYRGENPYPDTDDRGE